MSSERASISWEQFLSKLAALTLATVAAALSATIFKDAMLPDQISWLGSGGTLICMALLPICFALRGFLDKKSTRVVLCAGLLVSCLLLVWLRSSVVVSNTVNNTTRFYLVGYRLDDPGKKAKANCDVQTDEELLRCSGADQIPSLYGRSYILIRNLYLADYLLLVSFYIALVSVVELNETKSTQ
jgi:hypothetical protein